MFLSDMNIPTLSFLSFPFIWNIAFHPLTFNLCESFTLKWVSCGQHIVGYYFIIQSAILSLLIGTCSPLTFKVSIDKIRVNWHFNPGFPVDFVFLSYSILFLFVFPVVVWWFSFSLCLCSLFLLFVNLWLPCFSSILIHYYIYLL